MNGRGVRLDSARGGSRQMSAVAVATLIATAAWCRLAAGQVPVTGWDAAQIRQRVLSTCDQQRPSTPEPQEALGAIGVLRPTYAGNEPKSGFRSAVDLYVGLQPSGNPTWRWTVGGGGETAYWALDDGTMGGAAAAVGGGRVTEYEFTFGLHFDFAGDIIRPFVIVSFYSAPPDPVASAANPVVEPPTPVSSIGWIFDPIGGSPAGFASYRTGLIDLASLGLDFDLDESFYVEVLPLEWSSYPAGAPVVDPDVHAIFTGAGTVTYGSNQNHMWSDWWVRNATCAGVVFGDGDGYYDHPAEMDVCNSPTSLNQTGIVLRGLECSGANKLALRINEPDDICVQPGETVTVTLAQSCLPGLVRGYQAFLEFTPGQLSFVSGSYVLPWPYGLPIIVPIVADGGNIDLAAGIDNLSGQEPTSATADLVTLTFLTGPEEGLTSVSFRSHDPPTRFSDPYGQPVVPTLVDSPAICVDGTPPDIACPPDPRPQCITDVPAPAADYLEFVAQGGTASDGECYPAVTVTHVEDINNGGTGCPASPYVVSRTYRATDCAGNSADCVQTITVSDDTAPAATPPDPISVQCEAEVPAGATTIAEFLALPGASASDNCTSQGSLTVAWADGPLDGGPCGGTITRTYTIRDACDNPIAVEQVITVDDTIPPAASSSGPIGACYPTAAAAEAAALANSSATDNCAGLLTPSAVTVGTCSATVTVTFADQCGKVSNALDYATRIDGNPPVVTCPGDITTSADAGLCTSVVTWTAATANDDCDADISALVVYDIDLDDDGTVDTPNHVPTTYTFPAGTHRVIARATDTCGNEGTCSFYVIVNSVNDLIVTVEFQPAFAAGPVTRCITFELWKCPGTAPLATVEQTLTFVDGQATAALLTVPCGSYNCLTARDRLHTLRRTATLGISGPLYLANFTGDPAGGGDWLIRGNLNEDNWIDILDFGVFSYQYVSNPTPGANTTCSTPAPHADVSGDGLVNTADFSAIQVNFLKSHEANCCGQPGRAGTDGPVLAIPLEELRQRGLGYLRGGDLNHDGWLDVRDIVAFMNGARPEPLTEHAAPAPPELELLRGLVPEAAPRTRGHR